MSISTATPQQLAIIEGLYRENWSMTKWYTYQNVDPQRDTNALVEVDIGEKTFIYAWVNGINELHVYERQSDGAIVRTQAEGTDEPLTIQDDDTLHLQSTGHMGSVTVGGSTFLVANGARDSGVSIFRIDPDTGALTNTDNHAFSQDTFDNGSQLLSFEVDGKAYFTLKLLDENQSSIALFEIDAGGQIREISRLETDLDRLHGFDFATVDGQHILIATNQEDDRVETFSFDPDTGLSLIEHSKPDEERLAGYWSTAGATEISGQTYVVSNVVYERATGHNYHGISIHELKSDGTLSVAGVTPREFRLPNFDFTRVQEIDGREFLIGHIRGFTGEIVEPKRVVIFELQPGGNDIDATRTISINRIETSAHLTDPDDLDSYTGEFFEVGGKTFFVPLAIRSDDLMEAFELGGGTSLPAPDPLPEPEPEPDLNVMEGSDARDTLAGTAAADAIYGGGDRDKLYGNEGDDHLTAGTGNDTLFGGEGDDLLEGEAGRNRLYGGEGNDHLVAGTEGDRLYGDEGNDLLEGGIGNDTGYGGEGDDVLIDISGTNRLYGKEGDDALYGGTDQDRAYGGDGDDTLMGNLGDDMLYGDDGDDLLSGGDGDDRSYGGDGNDVDDAGDGDDRSYGGDGDDILTTGEGDDRAYGGHGDDLLNTGNGNDRLYGQNGVDELLAGAGDDKLYGGNDDDLLYAGGGDDTLRGGNGDDLLQAEEGDDDLRGDGGDDLLLAGAGDDFLDGGSGDDRLEGGAGDDSIEGGYGEDILIGGRGNDVLKGEKGADQYAFSEGDGIDHIIGLDYDDQVVFSTLYRSELDIRQVSESQWTIAYGSGDLVTIDLARGASFDADTQIITKIGSSEIELSDDTLTADLSDLVTFQISDLLANDSSLPAGFTVELAQTSAGGIGLSFDGETITFDPEGGLPDIAPGGTYTDSFTYTVIDSSGARARAVANLTLTNPATAPVGSDDRLSVQGEVGFFGEQEFELSSAISGSKRYASPGATNDGGFAVVWGDRYLDLRVEVFNRDGTTRVDETVVTTETVRGAYDGEVVFLKDGGFVVTWRDTYGGNTNLYARVFNADGAARTDPFELPAISDSRTYYPNITPLENGGFVTSWRHAGRGSDSDIRGAIYDRNGNQVVKEFLLHEENDTSQDRPDIVGLDTGNFAVVWRETVGSWPNSVSTIHARVLDPTGEEVVSTFQVNETPNGVHGIPNVEAIAGGGIAVVWHTYEPDNPDNHGLHGRIFNANGTAVTAELDLVEFSDRGSTSFESAWLSSNQLVVTWTLGAAYDNPYSPVLAKIFNADGSVAVDAFVVDDGQDTYLTNPDVSALEGGGFVVTWEYLVDGFHRSTKARVFNEQDGTGELPFAEEDSVTLIDPDTLLENDFDLQGEALSITGLDVASALGATLAIDPETGAISYDPREAETIQALDQGEVVEDSFTYTVSNEAGGTDIATVTLLVGGADELNSFDTL